MKLKKLGFSEADKLEIESMLELLAGVECSRESLSSTQGCGAICAISCSWYCENNCKESCAEMARDYSCAYREVESCSQRIIYAN